MPNTHGPHLHSNIWVKAGLPSSHFSITLGFWFLHLNKKPPSYHFIPWPYVYPRVPSKERSGNKALLGESSSGCHGVWCCMPAIPALKRQKPEKFRVIFGYVESVLVWVAWEPVPKNQNQMRGHWSALFWASMVRALPWFGHSGLFTD